MSRGAYQSRRDARARWPDLALFLHASLHGEDDKPVEADVRRVIASTSLEQRKQLASEWWDWNATAGAANDIRPAIESLEPDAVFADADHARTFMNSCYDELVMSIRRETGEKWKP